MTDAYRQGYDQINWTPLPAPEKPEPPRFARGAFSCPMVIGDSMDLTEHVDGKFYDSKSRYRAVTKAHGMVEVGTDPARLRKPEKPKADPQARRDVVRKAVQQAGF